jgi:TonB-linked SusC/RagA family outer membrane protein
MRANWTWSVGPSLRSALATLALVALPAVTAQAQAGGTTITGRVTAAGANEPLGEGRVMLVGTSIAATTNSDGKYTLRGVPSGTVEVRVIRVGYTEQKKAVTVAAGGATTLDFVMEPAIVKLQEIVTTATGEQRRVELGNSVTTLGDVTARVETAPIQNLGDLLVAKAAGVTVLPGSMTGTAPVVRIRGVGSLATAGSGINNNPIYVIDGVRMNSSSINLFTGGVVGSALNDIDPNEIEDVEIVKGPSAATLYGTDAANGVIVITTKKGHAGDTRWTWYGEGTAISDRTNYPADYASWGHVTAAAATAALPEGTLQRCTLVTESQGSCALDSLTSFNVLRDAAASSIRLGHGNQFGMNASGGNDALRFFLSGDLRNELGPVQMPGFAKATLDTMGTPLEDEWTHPEAFQSESFRANLSASVTPKLDVNANAGWSNTNQRLPQVDNNTYSFIYSALNNPGFNFDCLTDACANSGLFYSERGSLNEFLNGYGAFSPAQTFQALDENGTQRFIGSTDASWRPFAWMQNIGSAGIDYSNNAYNDLCRFNECPDSPPQRLGTVDAFQTNIRNVSFKLASNATWQARSNLNLKTTVGTDYTNLEQDQVRSFGQNLPPGAQTVGQSATRDADNQLQTVEKTLGVYAQEQASFRDRMFLIVAARQDQNSAFGTNFQNIFYPKASLSWIISDESFFPHQDWLNTFRLRAAYGASGVSPGGTAALRTFAARTAAITNDVPGSTNEADLPALVANALGNPNLKPERSGEFEGGFESSVFSNRFHIDFTYYNKKTHDGIINQPIAASSGASALSVLTNIASVQSSGLELNLNATVFDNRNFGWDITAATSHNSGKILDLGIDKTTGKKLGIIGTGTTRDSVGLPIDGFFVRPFTFADSNKDGIITPNEVQVTPNSAAGTKAGFVFAGYSVPRDIVSITNGFDLFNRKLRITVLTDYKGGYSINNSTTSFYATNFPTWSSENLKSTSLFDQARNVAASSALRTSTSSGYIENGQFWKLREASAALTLPNTVARRIRARDAQLVFEARNLHTWTGYTGFDPEQNSNSGDVQNTFSTLAAPTIFSLRVNLHY